MALNNAGGVAIFQAYETLPTVETEPARLLPHGFPDQVYSPMAWRGFDLKDLHQYVYELTAANLEEIQNALQAFKKLGLDGDLVSRDSFPLPNLHQILNALSGELHEGKGFFIIRGLNSQHYSVEDNTIVFLGIQTYVAELRGRQTENGNMIVHMISDNEQSSSALQPEASRPSDGSSLFHTDDIGDIIAFQDRATVTNNHTGVLASSYAIYNTLAATRPDVIQTLAAPDWPFFYPHYHRRPIIFYSSRKLIINFAFESILGSDKWPRPVECPKPTAKQLEALHILQSVAQHNALEFQTQSGDLRFVNNLSILHKRDVQIPEKGSVQRGHLVRLCLRNAQRRWKLPVEVEGWETGLGSNWDRVFDQGEDIERVWNIDPMPEAFFPMRQYGT